MRATINSDGKTLEVSDRDNDVCLVMSRHGPRVRFTVKTEDVARAISALINTPTMAASFLEFAEHQGEFEDWLKSRSLADAPSSADQIAAGKVYRNGKWTDAPTLPVDHPELRAAPHVVILSANEIRNGHKAGTIYRSNAVAMLRRDHGMTFNDADAYLAGDNSVMSDNAEYDACMNNNESFEAETETKAGELDTATLKQETIASPAAWRDLHEPTAAGLNAAADAIDRDAAARKARDDFNGAF